MKEDLLQFIWAHSLFNRSNLITDSGEAVRIQNTGVINKISGPDFSDARVYIGENLWIGNVEMHIRASDWNYHGHQNDGAYNSVILHVVSDNEKAILNAKKRGHSDNRIRRSNT